MHRGRAHHPPEPNFPVLSLQNGEGPEGYSVYLRQHADDRAPHVRIDDNAEFHCYQLTLTLAEAQRLAERLTNLTNQAGT